MEKIKIGKVLRPFGIKGELRVKILTDSVEDRFKAGATIYLSGEEFRIKSSRIHKGAVLLSLEGFDNINDVEAFRDMDIYFNKEARPLLASNQYYFDELLNLEAYVDSEKVGSITEVYDTPAHPVVRLSFSKNDETALIPFVKQFIKSVDLKNNRIDIIWMEGLW